MIFQRLHGRDAYGGTGIGLAMCKKIVEHHGGRMWLDTAAEHGATLRWTLPAVPAAPSTPVTNPAQVAGSAGIHEPGREEQDA